MHRLVVADTCWRVVVELLDDGDRKSDHRMLLLPTVEATYGSFYRIHRSVAPLLRRGIPKPRQHGQIIERDLAAIDQPVLLTIRCD